MARWTASAKWAEGPALDGQRDMPLALRLSEGLGISARGRPKRVSFCGSDSACRCPSQQEQSRCPASAAARHGSSGALGALRGQSLRVPNEGVPVRKGALVLAAEHLHLRFIHCFNHDRPPLAGLNLRKSILCNFLKGGSFFRHRGFLPQKEDELMSVANFRAIPFECACCRVGAFPWIQEDSSHLVAVSR